MRTACSKLESLADLGCLAAALGYGVKLRDRLHFLVRHLMIRNGKTFLPKSLVFSQSLLVELFPVGDTFKPYYLTADQEGFTKPLRQFGPTV